MSEAGNIQYDNSDHVLGGINIAEAIQTDKKLYFNESYFVVGSKLSAQTIYATYDLSIMGDVEADSIEVNGDLYVKGNIKASSIRCQKLTCLGKTFADSIVCDEGIVAKNVVSDELQTQGSVIVSDSIIINEECTVDGNIIAGEGISGTGRISANSAIAGDYYDFDGESNTGIYEISTMFKSENVVSNSGENVDDRPFDQRLEALLSDFVKSIIDEEEDHILSEIEKCADKQRISFSEMYYLFCEIDRISYLNSIDNLRDYLLIKYAEKRFPKEFREYETISHVFTVLLEGASEDEMDYSATNLMEFMMSLRIITIIYSDDIDKYADRVFSSVGLKYSFVNKQFERNSQ